MQRFDARSAQKQTSRGACHFSKNAARYQCCKACIAARASELLWQKETEMHLLRRWQRAGDSSLSSAQETSSHHACDCPVSYPDMARHTRHAGIHASNRLGGFHALLLVVPNRIHLAPLLQRGILDSVAKEKGCVAKPATELCLHGKHNARFCC